ncbi:MAG TPA: hypothetical protein DDY59_11760 [Lachnospiraceae bacterium]|nr:hypothetical protein [Lachnospiraceae bacterium]
MQELHAYLEYYNQKRIKKKLNYMSPIEYRLLNFAPNYLRFKATEIIFMMFICHAGIGFK